MEAKFLVDAHAIGQESLIEVIDPTWGLALLMSYDNTVPEGSINRHR